MKRMTVELDTHQKCVTNLAATVVRQNEQIRDLKQQVRELVSMLESQDRSSCTDSAMDVSECKYSDASPRSQSSISNESSKENDDGHALDAAIDAAKDLNAMLDQTRALIKLKRETARCSVKSSSKRHRRTRSLSGSYLCLDI